MSEHKQALPTHNKAHRARLTLKVLAVALAAPLAAHVGWVQAQQMPAESPDKYPSRPIRMVVPFSPGGFTDVVARVLSIKLGEDLGQTVVIDNKPGAGSTIGADMVAKSAPDGYTLLMISTTHVIGPALYKSLPYDAIKSFVPIGKLVEAPYVLVANPNVPVKTVKELIAYTKQRPGIVNYASSGNGSTQHLSGALFATMSGSPINHVPYRGSGQATADIIGGQVQLGFIGAPVAIQQSNAGRLRALAVTSDKRSPQLPNTPTLDEAGVPGYSASSWLGLLAPAGTPKEIVAKLNASIVKALSAPDTIKTLNESGVDVSTSTPEAFGQLMHVELDKWGKVVRDTGATIN